MDETQLRRLSTQMIRLQGHRRVANPRFAQWFDRDRRRDSEAVGDALPTAECDSAAVPYM